MKRLLIVLVIVIAILLVGVAYFYSRLYNTQRSANTSPTPSTTGTQSRHIIFPQGNETLMKGQIYTLTWTPGSGETQIFLINDSLASQGASVSIADRVYNINNTGNYPYPVPQNIPDGSYHFTIGDLKSASFTIASQAQSQNTSDCKPQDIQARLALSPGAGNVYGTFTLKNTSAKKCNIVGNNFVSVNYDTTSVTNIAVTHVGQPERSTFALASGQTLYSQIHYPNGPQCGGPTKIAQVSFSYFISPQNTVTFADQNNKQTQNIPVCQTPDPTTIQIWNISANPITPQ